MNYIVLASLVLFLLSPVSVEGAEVHGKIYRWDTLDLVKDVVVEIKDGSIQRMVSNDGSYSFNVTPGNYTIIAKTDGFIAVENITVKDSVRFDLILFPKLEVIEDVPDFPYISDEEQPYHIWVAILSGIVILILYYVKRRESKREEDLPPNLLTSDIIEDLPEDLVEVLEIITREGGRITQKELRRKLGYSEAKMSLIIADLERRGMIEKVKKGRGNIIFLK